MAFAGIVLVFEIATAVLMELTAIILEVVAFSLACLLAS